MTSLIFDRGPRPILRGWLHVGAAVAAAVAGILLVVVASMRAESTATVTATAIYAACFTATMAVSGIYHRWRFRSLKSVTAWRRADHAMIAVFIAGTYGPIATSVLPPDTAIRLLIMCWAGALAAVIVNVAWIGHPRWVDVVIYLFLGWLVIWEVPALVAGAGWTVTILLAVGGIIYSIGALFYGLKWPNPSPRWFGFHEVFHAGTIIAAILHYIAIWLVVW